MALRTTFVSLLFLIIGTNTSTADTPITIGDKLNINFHSGFLHHHHKEMEVFSQKKVYALEFSHVFVSNGNKLWHSVYGFPNYGVSYKFMDLGSPDILGYAHCLYPFVTFPILNESENWNLGFRVGPGLGYVTKTFHRTENFKNSAISTNINAYILLGLNGSYNINNKLRINAGLNLSHFSNGTVKKPNSGLNFTFFSFGIDYLYRNQPIENLNSYPFSNEENRILIVGSGSQKEVKGAGGPKHGVTSFSVEYSKPIRTLLRYGVSLDLMNDNSNEFILEYEDVSWTNEWELLKVGSSITTEVILNRMSAVLYFGGYLYNKARYSGDGHLYQRLALRYRFSNRAWGHIALKTHWGSADYLEIGGAIKLY